MDLRNILNTESNTDNSRTTVHRSASLAQPHGHPPLLRQTSMPNYPSDLNRQYSPPASQSYHQPPTQTSTLRERSLSVSPKTKVTTLSAAQIYPSSEFEPFQTPTPVSNNGHPIETPQYQQYRQSSIHSSPIQTMMAPPLYTNNSPVQTIRPQQSSHSSTTSLHTPPAHAVPYTAHTQQPTHSPVSYLHSASSAHNSIPHARRASQVSAMTSSPTAHSRKRSLESAASESSVQPALKRRKYEVAPIWAQRYDRSREKQHANSRKAPPQLPQQTHRSVTPVERKVNGHRPTPPPHREERESRETRVDRDFQQGIPPGMEPSFDNVIPYNDVVMRIADRIYEFLIQCPFELDQGSNWEVEAKLGRIVDKRDNERIFLPVESETIIREDWARDNTRFDSKMGMAQHKALNKYLNVETARAQQPHRQPIKYKHVVEVDKFYRVPEEILTRLPDSVQQCRRQKSQFTPRVRVTYDAKTGEIKDKIIKFRLDDIEVYCPFKDNQYDYRVSISMEYKYPFGIDGLEEALENGISQDRRKDRMSYSHQDMQLDLTQIRDPQQPDTEPKHEMEVELKPERVLEEGRKNLHGLPNHYESLIGTFLNYVRALSRAEVGIPQQ